MPRYFRIASALLILTGLLWYGWRTWPREFTEGPAGPAPAESRLTEPAESRKGPWPVGIAYGDLTVSNTRGGVEAQRKDGQMYWRYSRLLAPAITWYTALDDRRVLVAWCDDRVAAVDVATGELTWSVLLPPGPEDAECEGGTDDQTVHMWTVTIGHDTVDVSRAGHHTRLNASTGALLDH